jgi:hypothetical protein
MADHAHTDSAHATDHHDQGHKPPESFEVRILRQDAPGQSSYWERHRVKYEPEMNVISVLQRIAARATDVDGKKVHHADQRQGAAVVLGPGRSPAGRQPRRDRTAANVEVSGRARPGR